MSSACSVSSFSIRAGQVCAIHASGSGLVLATAVSIAKPAIGFARRNIPAAVAGEVLTDGILELPDWTPVIGTPLLSRGEYFLDAVTPGRMTQAPTSTLTQTNQSLGYAISPNKFDISIETPILL